MNSSLSGYIPYRYIFFHSALSKKVIIDSAWYAIGCAKLLTPVNTLDNINAIVCIGSYLGYKMSSVIDEKDFQKPIIRRKALSATNDTSLATIIDFGEFEPFIYDEPEIHGGGGKGPTPLTGVLAALCACASVTFSRTAKEMAFDYSGIKYQAAFTIDIRGRMGVKGVVPHFQTVKIEARVSTEESSSDLAKVVEETEARCPIFNLIKDAGVRIKIVWIRQSEDLEQQLQ
jgi:uncharacterized OsmC-like protein